jgi:hypothetical protein
MGMIFLAPPHCLFVERMRETPFDPHDDGFVIRVGYDNTL